MREKKKSKVLKSFNDLRPNTLITCFYCGEEKSSENSRKFRAHCVCHDCVVKLDSLPSEK